MVQEIDSSAINIVNDEPTTMDCLKRAQFAQAFSNIAETCETPLVIGLYGGWGVGKTSLMRQIEAKLDKNKVESVWYDPWQHQFEEYPILSLIQQIMTKADDACYEACKKIMTIIASSFGSAFLRNTVGLTLAEIDEYGKRYEEERFLTRDRQVKIKAHFKQLIDKLRDGCKKRIVIFIDDMDRCLPENTLSLLEAIKLYLNVDGCVFIIAVDRSMIIKSIESKYKDIDINGNEYMSKIVQLPFSIPPIEPSSLEGFIGPMLTEELKGCCNLLVSGLGGNPREIKRFINTLILNCQLAKPNITNPDYKVLALLLMVQLIEPDLYTMFTTNYSLLEKIKNNMSDTEDIRTNFIECNPWLEKAFEEVESIPVEEEFQKYIYLTEVAGIENKPDDDSTNKHMENINELICKHEKWVESNGQEGQRISLSQSNLMGVNWSGRNLWCAGLHSVILKNAILRECNLEKAEMSDSNIKNADITSANLQSAQLRNSDLKEATLVGANLKKALLSGAKLQSSNLTNCNLKEAVIIGADLQDAIFTDANVSKTDFSGSNLKYSNISAEQLEQCETDGYTILPNGKMGPFKPIIGL